MKQTRQTPGRIEKIKLFALVFPTFIAFTAYTGYNLFETAVNKSEYYRAKANNQQINSYVINANRGTIYDRNGKILAKSTTVWTAVISPYDIALNDDDAESVCRMLSDILGVDFDKLLKICENTESRYEIVKKKVSKEQREEINRVKEEKGISYYSVYLEEDSTRNYPNDSLASNIIGFTDYNNKGIYGVEATYDSYLQGRDGRRVTLNDSSGRAVDSEFESLHDAVDGDDVYMTVDTVLQHYLEKNLEIIISQHNVANRATGIMMNPNTGAILAMATTGGYDLNNPTGLSAENLSELDELYLRLTSEAMLEYGTLTHETEQEIEREIALVEARMWEFQWSNKAITELYYPGSVFKTITCAAALEEKVVGLHSEFFCGGKVTVADREINCWQTYGHGTLDLVQAISKSCNPGFIDISARLGKEKFCDYFEAFGFTERTGIDLPAEQAPYYMPRGRMGKVELAMSSFGQTNKITPIQMITAYAACVNGGYLVTPYVVEKIVDKDGNIVKSNETQVKRQVLSGETSAQMREILEEVVRFNGGNNAYISGYKIGGKSGTSQKIDDYGEDEMRYVASFCAFAPADNPQVIILVIVDEPNPGGLPYYGSTVAAPVVSAVFKECFGYLEIYPQYTAEEQAAMDTVTPYLTGLSPIEVTTKLNTEGLNADFIGSGNKTLKTVPAAGQPIARGGTVVVYLEERENIKAAVPDVRGMTVAEANRAIGEAGLNIRLSGGAVDNENAKAYYQSASPHTTVNAGTVIEVGFAVDEGFGG
ncbi:MAG: PASTA domain-containing protein [Oscillospiraceae bacterium]|jgi:stage V sporulation protein D (sporulation-specific penicillin-binding protein)|nr:PASTA domain-containing protein [Oscillospiraceae bacterium]